MKSKEKVLMTESDTAESDEPSEEEHVINSDEEYDDSFENLEENEMNDKENVHFTSKRKNDEESRSRKKRKHDIKPPTAEEMIRLKETENLYQSNLFRLQVEEMISELKPRKTDKNAIKQWVQHFKEFLLKLEDCEEIEVNNRNQIIEDIVLPLPKRGWQVDDKIQLFKPSDVLLMGSYPNGTVLGPHFVLDVILILPKKFFQKDDHLNQKYHYKRAFYLCMFAARLKESQLVSTNTEIKFWLKNGDPLKPVILFRPEGKMTQFVEVALSILPEDSPFKLNRFLPEKNNIRPEWWGIERKPGKLPSTPYYNMSILEDIVATKNEELKLKTFEGNQSLKDAVVLLSVWLKQRKLSEGFGAFNTHLLTMFMVYLIKKQKINNYMSSYQISRNVWLAFVQTDWTKNGISLCNEESPECTAEEFHNFFEVVFIDSTGLFNLCYRLSKCIYLRIREEAQKAITFLNDSKMNSFQALFMVNMPFIHQYDHYISFTDPEVIENTVTKYCDADKIMDYCGYGLPLFIQLVNDLLIEGLGNRLKYLCVQPVSSHKWKLSENNPGTRINDVLIFGLKLNPEAALSVIEKGPEANNDQAAKFRNFWGEKCELRRFRDGSVSESVCWHTGDATLNDRRLIVNKIVEYLLKQKFKISTNEYNYIANQLDHLAINKFELENTNEEASQAVHKVYELLSQQLRDLTDIPLSIVSVRCISPVYRFTDVFPPVPIKHSLNRQICKYSKHGIIFRENCEYKAMPFYVEPIDLVLQMAMSQKWPNDLKAGKRLITAFNIVLASSLKKHYGLNCQITTDYVAVQKDGYLFRLHLGYSKEIALLKQQISNEGVTFYRDTPDSIALEKKFINLPKVTGALYGLSQTYSGYGFATCLAKRWIISHFFDDFHFPTLVIELLMARLFINSQPYEVAVQPLTAFLRFLNFLVTTNWHIEPIIVNFNNLLIREQITSIEKSFQSNRDSLPPLVLATPYDMVGSLWTKDAPTLPTLIRICKLAAASLKMLNVLLTTAPTQHCLKKVFDPPLSHYDVLITLNKQLLPRRLQCIDVKWDKESKKPLILPIAEFDPATLYLQELREKYSDYALFFHNTYGGTVIGVIFKPSFLEATEFKISQVGPRTPSLSEGKISLVPNKEALIDGFRVLGAGIVTSIKQKTD